MLKLISCSLIVLGLCAAPVLYAQAEWYSSTQSKMGTRVEVKIWYDDAQEAKRLIDLSMAELDRIEAEMSTFIADSEMTRINETAATEPVAISPELFTLIDRALQLSVTTNGAFDITYDSVGQLYDFRAGIHPEPEQIETRLDAIDYPHVHLDREAA